MVRPHPSSILFSYTTLFRSPRYVSRPRFAERACEREQHRTLCKRHDSVFVTHDMTASVDDECFRREQRFDVLEPQDSLRAIRSEEHTSELQSHSDLVCRLLL